MAPFRHGGTQGTVTAVDVHRTVKVLMQSEGVEKSFIHSQTDPFHRESRRILWRSGTCSSPRRLLRSYRVSHTEPALRESEETT